MKHVNTFITGMDSDSSPEAIDNRSIRKGVNIQFMGEGSHGSIENISDTIKIGDLSATASGVVVLGYVSSYGTFNSVRSRGIVLFTYSDEGGQIYFYDIEGGESHLMGSHPFVGTEEIDAYSFSDANGDFVYFVYPDGYYYIKIKDGESVKQGVPVLPDSELVFDSIINEGSLKGGTYSFLFRFYNTSTTDYTAFSGVLGGIRIWDGNRIGVICEKSIKLNIAQQSGYDSIQMLVIEHIDGTRGRRLVGKLLNPSKTAYDAASFTYSSNEQGVTVDLSEYVIDGLPILGAKTITNLKERNFLGGLSLRNGIGVSVGFEAAETVRLALEKDAYSDEVKSTENRGYWRDEEYAFGIRCIDANGYSIVVPLDLSNSSLHGDWTWKFPSRDDPNHTLFNAADKIQALGLKLRGLTDFPDWAVAFEVVRANRIKDVVSQIVHVPTIAVQGNFNRKTSYFQYGTKDYTGDLDGLHPKVFKYGAAKNISNYELEAGTGFTFQTIVLKDQPYGSWLMVADSDSGGNEISPVIFAQRPEYIHTIADGESYDSESLEGYIADIVDAVALRRVNKVDELGDTGSLYDQANNNTVFVDLYEATGRDQYYYNTINPEKLETRITSPYFKKESKIRIQQDLARGHQKVTLPERPMSGEHFREIALYGSLLELVVEQRSDDAVPAYWDRYFSPSYVGQEGQLLFLEDRIMDFTKVMYDEKASGDDYFPLLTWTHLSDWVTGGQSRTFTGGQKLNLSGTDYATPNNDIAGGAYIMNIKKGLNSGRYGDINEDREWIGTGVVQFLDGSDSYDVDVYGGDCYITKHSIRVSNTAPRPFTYGAVIDALQDIEGGTTTGGEEAIKVGAAQAQVEILDVYLESDINGEMRYSSGYPKIDDNVLNTYSETRYEYNPAYSSEMDSKVYFGGSNLETNDQNLVASSDVNVRGAVNTALVQTRGFDKFKVNNVYSIDSKLGKVVKLETVEGQNLYAFQENGVFLLPISQLETTLQDGVTLAVGTGELFGNGGRYIQRGVGIHSLYHLLKRDNKIYGLDIDRQLAFGVSSSGWENISLKKNDKRVRDFISSLDDIRLGYDCRYERVVYHSGGKALLYDVRGGFWTTELDFPEFTLYDGVADDAIILKGSEVYRPHSGTYTNTFLGVNKDSVISFVVNNASDISKVFSVLKVNSNASPQWVRITALDPTSQVTEKLSFAFKNESYYQNLIRDKDIVSNKLRGRTFLVEIWINGSKVSISSVITENRQVR